VNESARGRAPSAPGRRPGDPGTSHRRRTGIAVAAITTLAALGFSAVAIAAPLTGPDPAAHTAPAWTSADGSEPPPQPEAAGRAPAGSGDGASLDAVPPDGQVSELPALSPFAPGAGAPAPEEPAVAPPPVPEVAAGVPVVPAEDPSAPDPAPPAAPAPVPPADPAPAPRAAPAPPAAPVPVPASDLVTDPPVALAAPVPDSAPTATATGEGGREASRDPVQPIERRAVPQSAASQDARPDPEGTQPDRDPSRKPEPASPPSRTTAPETTKPQDTKRQGTAPRTSESRDSGPDAEAPRAVRSEQRGTRGQSEPGTRTAPAPRCTTTGENLRTKARKGEDGDLTGATVSGLPDPCDGKQVRLLVHRKSGKTVEATTKIEDGQANFTLPDAVAPSEVRGMQMALRP
jgi:hypothetical protein